VITLINQIGMILRAGILILKVIDIIVSGVFDFRLSLIHFFLGFGDGVAGHGDEAGELS
jgi:hypothetical protein